MKAEAETGKDGYRRKERQMEKLGEKCWQLRWSWHHMLCLWPLVGSWKLYPFGRKKCGGCTVKTLFFFHIFELPETSIHLLVLNQIPQYLLSVFAYFIQHKSFVIHPSFCPDLDMGLFINPPPHLSSYPFFSSLPTVTIFSAAPLRHI